MRDTHFWDDLRLRLEVSLPEPGFVLNPATPQSLAEYEAQAGFRLPTEYKEYVSRFGPGTLGGYFRVFAPGYLNSNAGDLRAFQAVVAGAREVFREVYGQPALVERMIPFGDTIGGDVFAWDPETVTENPLDFAVFVFPDDSDRVLRIASGFREFVADVCLGAGFREVIRDPKWNPLQDFRPFEGSTL